MTRPPEPPSIDLSRIAESLPKRLEIDGESARREIGQLVLTLVELIRNVVEHQAVRRMDDSDVTEDQVERMGVSLMELDRTVDELCDVFGVEREDLGIDLGPLTLE